MKRSSTVCRQKNMNRTRIRQWADTVTQIKRISRKPDTVNADLFIKINRPLEINFTNRSKQAQ